MSPERAYNLRMDGCNGSFHMHLAYHGQKTGITLTLKDQTVFAEAHGHRNSGFDVNSLKTKSKEYLDREVKNKFARVPLENRRIPSGKAYPLVV